jgi:hypothetical protein
MEILKMKKLIVLIPVFLIASCVKKADIDLPPRQEKLVVTCLISPQEQFITATVRSSIPKYSQYSFYSGKGILEGDILDATITISDGSRSATIPVGADSIYKLSAAEFPILPGRSYTLNVSTPSGKKLNATTVVPEDSLVTEFTDVFYRQNTATVVDFDMGINVHDIPNKTTYVMVHAKSISITRGKFNFQNVQEYDQIALLDTDEKVSKKMYYGAYSDFAMAEDSVLLVAGYFFNLNCSKDFYLYHKSVRDAAGASGDPFAEPALVYSNINGGFGCFGSYILSRKEKMIRS